MLEKSGVREGGRLCPKAGNAGTRDGREGCEFFGSLSSSKLRPGGLTSTLVAIRRSSRGAQRPPTR
jgi:hypothetical protein